MKTDVSLSSESNKNVFKRNIERIKKLMMKNFHAINLRHKNIWFVTNNVIL